MSPARIIILAVAVLAGLGAALLVGRPKKAAAPPPQAIAAPTVPVLVAAADIGIGTKLSAGDMRWIDWPEASVPAGVVRRDQSPQGDADLVGQIARFPMLASEPVRADKLIRTDGTGFLSAVLPAGYRAIAISTDSRGANTAGGFILPNDRVDVIKTTREDKSGDENFASETILVNVRVLAIGQNVQERNGEKVVIGETATLEVDPRQVELIAQAQKSGTLSLALRSLRDAGEAGRPGEQGGLTLVRYGVTSKSGKQ